MQPIRVTIDVDPQKIPELVCCDYSTREDSSEQQIAVAVAKELGIEEYLAQPDRIYELRRWMWERGDTLALQSRVNESITLEMSAD